MNFLRRLWLMLVGDTYTVKSGDTLSAIALKYYGDASKYPAIFDANRNLPQPGNLPRLTDANKIYPGQVLRIPRR